MIFYYFPTSFPFLLLYPLPLKAFIPAGLYMFRFSICDPLTLTRLSCPGVSGVLFA